MKAQNELIAMRLNQHLPIKTRPEAWLSAHKTEVLTLLKAEPIGELTELTGLSTGTIQRWRRKAEARPVPPVQEVSLESDVSYYRGRAEAFEQALAMMTGAKRP